MAKKSALDNLTQLEWLEFVNKTDMDKVRTCPQCGEDIEYSNYHNMLRAIRSHSLCKKCGSKNNFDKINNDQKNNTKICKKCGEEYIGHKKSLYCKKCRSKTFYERNIKFRLKYPDKQKNIKRKIMKGVMCGFAKKRTNITSQLEISILMEKDFY